MRKSFYKILLIALLFIIVAAGCNININGDIIDNGATSRDNEINFTKVWEIDRVSEDFRPTVHGNEIFALTSQFSCIDNDGKVKWNTFLLGNLIDVICINNGSLVIAGGNKINCLNRKAGQIIWEFDAQEEILSGPVEKDGIIYFTAGEGSLYAVDLSDGKEVWSFMVKGAPSVQYLSNPIIVGNTVFFSSGLSNVLFAIDIATHEERWKVEDLNSHNASLFADETNVYLVNGDGGIYAFDADNGSMKWEKNIGSSIITDCTLMDGNLYFYSYDNHIFSIDLNNGDTDFEYIFEGKFGIADICVTQDRLFITTYEDLASIDLTGNNFMSYRLDSCPAKKIVLFEKEAYITTTDNRLVKYTLNTNDL